MDVIFAKLFTCYTIKALLTNGILGLGELAEEPEEAFTAEGTLNKYFSFVLLIMH